MIDKIKNTAARAEVSKGQFLSILVIVVLLFISGGSLFTSLFARNQMNFVFSYFEGDMATVAETEMRASEFPVYMHNQAEYATNNAALVLGENGSYADWNKTHMPTKEYLMHRYNETIVAHGEYGLRANDYFRGCSQTPKVDYYNITESTFGGNWYFEYSVDKKLLACGGGRWGTKAFQEVEMESYRGPEVDDHLEISHNYIELSRYARNLTEAIRQEIPQTQTWGTSTGTTSHCDPTSSDKQDKRNAVHKDARQNAVDNVVGVVEEAVDATDKPSYFSVDSVESPSWWPRKDDPNNVTDVDCSLTHTHDNGTCLSEDCDGAYYSSIDETIQHSHSDYRGAHEDDCDDYDCMTHTHSHEQDPDILVKKQYDYNVSLATYYAEIEMTDDEEQVVTHDGKVNIPFNFQYNHTINPSSPY